MKRKIQSLALVLVASILTAMVWPLTESAKIVEASPIKNWTSNEQISYSDLNNNFNHLHASAGHGHGPIITANDIASNAAIRPEQTTFGAAINRTQVFEGTFKKNPDAGNTYVPVNSSGSLVVSVVSIGNIIDGGATGFTIDGAAAAGANPDGGLDMYTIFYKAVNLGIADYSVCLDQGTVSLHSPLHVAADCIDFTSWNATMVMKAPGGVAVEVYSNKVQ